MPEKPVGNDAQTAIESSVARALAAPRNCSGIATVMTLRALPSQKKLLAAPVSRFQTISVRCAPRVPQDSLHIVVVLIVLYQQGRLE